MVRNLLLTYYQFHIQRLHQLKNTLIPIHSCIKILNKASNVFTSLFSATIPSAAALDVTGIQYELRLLVYHHCISSLYIAYLLHFFCRQFLDIFLHSFPFDKVYVEQFNLLILFFISPFFLLLLLFQSLFKFESNTDSDFFFLFRSYDILLFIASILNYIISPSQF